MRGDRSATTLPASMGLLWTSVKADGQQMFVQISNEGAWRSENWKRAKITCGQCCQQIGCRIAFWQSPTTQ